MNRIFNNNQFCNRVTRKLRDLFIYILVFMLICISKVLAQNSAKLCGIYVGKWGGTTWFYEFKNDSVYLHKTTGRAGGTSTIGTYKISSDTLFLSPYKKSMQRSNHSIIAPDVLILTRDSCLIQLSTRYDYCKSRKGDKVHYKSIKRSI